MGKYLFLAFFVSMGLFAGDALANPSGQPTALSGEDCVSFNPQRAEIQPFGSSVRLIDGNHALMLFEDSQEAAEALEVIRHYGFNRSCFVGRPGPSLHYFLVDDRAPMGAMPDEDCVGFDPERVEARQVQGSWKIVENGRWLLDFAEARIEAYTALAIMRHHGFTHSCFVARPGPALTYLRRDGDPAIAAEAAPSQAGQPGPPAPQSFVSAPLNIPQEHLVLHLDAAHGYSNGVWRDQSASGNHAEQSNPDRWPQLVESAVGGYPALAFDGENDVLVSTLDINPDVHPEITAFVVFDSRTGERVHRKLFGHDNGGFDRAVGLDSRSAKNLVFFGGRRGRTTSIVDIEADEWYLLTMTYTPTSASAWVNGSKVADSVQVNNGRGESVTMIGNGGAGSSEWWGSIAEVVFYGADLSADKRREIEMQLMEKYGL